MSFLNLYRDDNINNFPELLYLFRAGQPIEAMIPSHKRPIITTDSIGLAINAQQYRHVTFRPSSSAGSSASKREQNWGS